MNKLRELIDPNSKRNIDIRKRAEEYRKEAIKNKKCYTCIHYSFKDYIPNYIDYQVDCDCGLCAWFNRPYDCEKYELNPDY